LLGPALLQIELGNAFLKFVRRGDMSVNEARTALDQVSRDVRVRSAASLVERAFQIGLDHQRSAYDGLYVALAIDEGLQLVTADRKLYDATNSAFPDTLLWIEDL
jgi:predicted nucleic acid-binding protein